MGHGLCNCFAGLRGLLYVEVEPMTHKQLTTKVAKFIHGMNSHGNLLRPWNHEKDCGHCERLTDFIEKILEDYNEAEGVWYPKHDGESVLKRRARFYSRLPKGTTFGEARRLWNKSTFIEKISGEPHVDCGKVMHLFRCPTCKVQGYCDGGGFCSHETHTFK